MTSWVSHAPLADRTRKLEQDYHLIKYGLGGFYQGSVMDRYLGDDVDEALFDEFTEFPGIELDMARTRVWTKDMEFATQRWYKCQRMKGNADPSACFEEGEALRAAHWKHALEVEESGCKKYWFRFAKCIQRWRGIDLCDMYSEELQSCVLSAGNMNLVPDTPKPLQRVKAYSGYFWKDIPEYMRWNRNRLKWMKEHPNWFRSEDIELMNPKQIYDFLKKKEPYIDRGDQKFWSTFSIPIRYQDYISHRDLPQSYQGWKGSVRFEPFREWNLT